MTQTFEWWLGVDWGGAAHELCLIDGTGAVVGTRTVAHTAVAVHEAVGWIRAQTGAEPAAIAVAIETPRGVLVDTLIEQGFPVFALNPKQLDRFRDRFSVAGAKDDARDAHALADGLRTDRRAFRPVRPDDPLILQLRELGRLREELLEEERRLANRLRDQLYRVDAAWLSFSPAADEPWLWTVLAETPDPAAWAQLPRRRLTSVLRAHRIRRLTTDEVIAVLRQPRLRVAPGVPEAVTARIAALVPQLRVVYAQRTDSERQIDRLLERLARVEHAESEPAEHRDVEILQSLPGAGRMVTATMLGEASALVADRDYHMLRAYAGAAPVTKRSGKRLCVHMRYACNQRMRAALYHWSRISIQHDEAARAYYDALRTRGHGHARALRSVADRWLRILVAMLRTKKLYDPSRFVQAVAVPA